MKTYTIGIDLGGTTITAGLVDESGNILHRAGCATALPRPSEQVEASMADLCCSLMALLPKGAVLNGVGIGTPGSVDGRQGMVHFNPNFGYEHWPLGPNMAKLLRLSVVIENDANAAAYGEYCAGAAKGKQSAVVVTLGTGVGCGIVLNGRLFTGMNGAGGELGHTVIVKDGRACTCGRNGCWERYASMSALVSDAAEAMQGTPNSLLWKISGGPDKLDGKLFFDALNQGDELAQTLFDRWIGYVGCGLVNLVNVFQPQILCLGGGVSRQDEKILEPLRRILCEENFARNMQPRTELTTCTLHENAGLIGAACLARGNV